MYFTYSVIGISLIGMLIVLAESLKRFLKTRKIDELVLFLLLLLVSYSLTVPLIAGEYGGEIASRLFGGIRYILVIFVALALKNEKIKKLLTISLIVFVYLHAICTYGNMQYDYVAPNELAGIYYTSSNLNSPFYTLSDPLWDIVPKYLENPWKYIRPLNYANQSEEHIVVISSRRVAGAMFFTGNEIETEPLMFQYSIVYSSDTIYREARSVFKIYTSG